jgi:spore coat-associated protein N
MPYASRSLDQESANAASRTRQDNAPSSEHDEDTLAAHETLEPEDYADANAVLGVDRGHQVPLASFGATAGSLALFTDTATVAANDFTAGAIDIAAAPASAMISYSPMMPGDSVTGTLTVSNAGSAQLRYAMTTVTTNPDGKGLNAAIALEIRTQGTSCAAFDGVSLYSGTLAAAAMGSVAAGNQAGDRTLNGGTGEVLCFRASLPIGTGNGYQAATTTATFTFDAEQTANNP